MIKLNNRGFAITTILFGITLLFCLLLVSLLGILNIYWSNMRLLVDGVDGTTGARNVVIIRKKEVTDQSSATSDVVKNKRGGLYCIKNTNTYTCSYYSSDGTAKQ